MLKKYIYFKLKIIINRLFKMLSFFFKTDSNCIIVGGWFGERFADNSKSIFLFLCNNFQELNLKSVIFVSKDKNLVKNIRIKGYKSLYMYSLKSFYWHLKSGIHIVDTGGGGDVVGWLSINAKKINLWHGFPLKKIGCYLEENIEKEKEIKVKGDWKNQFVLSLSETHKNINKIAFGCTEHKSIIGIYPRDYYMVFCKKKLYLDKEELIRNEIINLKIKKSKIICYMPTFRDLEIQNNKLILSINELESFLRNKQIYLITKLHFATQINNTNIISSPYIINLPKESDVYNFLEYTDALITDYSSIYFDYLLLNKPIIFYCFDLEYYQNTDRGFLFDYSKFTPGEKVYNIEDLKKTILISLSFTDEYNEKYDDIKINVMKTVYNSILPTEEKMNELVKKILD